MIKLIFNHKFFFITIDLLNWYVIPSVTRLEDWSDTKQPVILDENDAEMWLEYKSKTFHRKVLVHYTLFFLCLRFNIKVYTKTWAAKFPKNYNALQKKAA